MRTASFITADPDSPRQVMQAGQIEFLTKINAVLVWSCVVLAVGLAGFHYYSPSVPLVEAALPVQAAAAIEEFVPPSPATDGRTAGIRNLFVRGTVSAGDSVDFSSQYKVVGIILDRDSQAVLKDRQSGKSVFVHKGDRLGEAVVGDIQDGKVVLSLGDRQWELRP